MKKVKIVLIKMLISLIILLMILTISACQVFLGPDPANNPQGIFDQIWNDFNETYALFEFKGIDWNAAYEKYSPQITQDMSDFDLFRICSEMLNSLNDVHVRLSGPFGDSLFFAYDDLDYRDISYELRKDFYLNEIRGYLERGGNFAGNGRFLYGVFEDNPRIGYIYIEEFATDFNIGPDIIPDWVKDINAIVALLNDTTDSLVLDVRDNMGGIGSNMDYIASRFVSIARPYIQSRTKNGPRRDDFSSFVTWTIKPAGTRYTKPIVLLTNGTTISAAEWFVLALRTQRHVTHMGTKTGGGFSTRIIRPLINGWKYSISVQEVRDMDGVCYEGKGIPPRVEVEYDPNFYFDLQLEEAFAFLN